MKRRTWVAALAAAATGGATLVVACVGDDPVGTTPSGVDGGGTDTAAAGDTSTGDTGTPGQDAGGDAAQPNDAGADSSCANKFPDATFCDDFDNGGYQPDWNKDTFNAGPPAVTIGIVSSPVFSNPYALSAYTLLPVPDGGSTATYLRVQRPTLGKNEFKLDVEMRQLAATTQNVNASPFSISLVVGPKAQLSLQVRPQTGVAVCTTPSKIVGADGGFIEGDMTFTYGVWQHVTLKISLEGSNTAALSCQVGSETKTDINDATQIDAMATATVGLGAPSGTGAISYVFDDVVLDIK